MPRYRVEREDGQVLHVTCDNEDRAINIANARRGDDDFSYIPPRKKVKSVTVCEVDNGQVHSIPG